MLSHYPNKMMTTGGIRVPSMCPLCHGDGTGFHPGYACPRCEGSGRVWLDASGTYCEACPAAQPEACPPIACGQVVARPNGDIAGTETA